MDGLLAGATDALTRHQVESPVVLRVPGSFELPVVAAALAAQGFDAIIALGVVIRGGTPHFDYVCSAATDGLSRVALDHGVAIGFGLLTCDDRGTGHGSRRSGRQSRGQGVRRDERGPSHRSDVAPDSAP